MRRFRGAIILCGAAIFVMLGMQNAGGNSDPFWAKQYGPVQIGAPTAWQKSTGRA